VKLLPELTDKMDMLYRDIYASLGQLPVEQKSYLFGFDGYEDYDCIDMVAGYITLEFIKYSYDYADLEYPLRHFFKNKEDDSERMTQSRNMNYVLKYKKREIEEKGGSIPENHKFACTDMKTIGKKLKGHRLTKMNYFEQQKILELELIKSIVERRIISSKKVSNTRFQEMFSQYDEFVCSLIEQSKKSDEDMVFASLALFTFEWHYPVETFYELACFMEKEGIYTLNQEMLFLICGWVRIKSKFGGCFETDSRMVKERRFINTYLFREDADEFRQKSLMDLIQEILVLVAKYRESIVTDEGDLYKDWFRKESNMTDWASFFRFYDIFSIWQKKEWTGVRIRNMRYLFDMVITSEI